MRITETQRVLQIVGDLDRLVVGVRDPALKRVGLSREPWQVLRLLADGNGHAMGEISEVLGLAGATATRVVDSLVQKMLVYRRNDPFDRRRVLIHVAEPGLELLKQVDEAMLEKTESMLAAFEPKERAALVQLLERLTSTSSTAQRQ
ncbi:MarR family winged helix-turn-helix transcriptional regulator [Phytoactinopolyspora mesophila]|uniref:MarR family transcriptional regulator n=1 Tax=Phytoactinopolyspora mesophila TaxID=2650750 RepID=A0A7K3M8U0_9ACTN|nr:MarR family transcriptional regulator [Phytoactinopolyspora mesophila]NDL59689.1 MarR family transcriptional regulator [Phytoactinopolyspora mesophila]